MTIVHNSRCGHLEDCLPCIHARRLKIWLLQPKSDSTFSLCQCYNQSLAAHLAHVDTRALLFVLLHHYSAGIAFDTGSNSAQPLLTLLEYALQYVLIVGVHMLDGEQNRA